MLKIAQIEKWIGEKKLIKEDGPISGKAFLKYGIVVVLRNEKGQPIDVLASLKELIKYPTWIIEGRETDTWDDLERFLGKFTPEELKALEVIVEE